MLGDLNAYLVSDTEITNFNTCKLNMVVNMLRKGRDRPDVGLCWAVKGGGNPGLLWNIIASIWRVVNMALPPARQKGKNGRPVYSQSARAVKYRKEKKVGEFAEDAAAVLDESPNPTLLDASLESVPAPGRYSTEAIGVTSDAVIYDYEPEPEPEDNKTRYFCADCSTTTSKTYIETSDTHCPICEEPINWDALK